MPVVVVAVLVMVSVEVVAAAPVIDADAGDSAQVGTLVAPDGPVTEHVSATLPVKPFVGVAVTVEVPELPAVKVTGVAADNVKPPTVNGTVPVCVMLPDVPVSVTE